MMNTEAEVARENEQNTVSESNMEEDAIPKELKNGKSTEEANGGNKTSSDGGAVEAPNEINLRDIIEVTAVLSEAYDYTYHHEFEEEDDPEPEWQVSLHLRNGSVTQTAPGVHINDPEYIRKFLDVPVQTPVDMRTLRDLMNVIKDKKPSEFPCSTFAFLGGRLDNPELQEFFKNFGSRVKRLTLEVFNCDMDDSFLTEETPVKELKELLEVLAPNIDTLHLDDFPMDQIEELEESGAKKEGQEVKDGETTQFFSKDAQLPNLKYLEVPKEAPEWVESEFRRVAPNLMELSRF